MTIKDRYKPIRKGHIYCAPFCGGNCTWDAYHKAALAANDLVAQLEAAFGTGWKANTTENLGWFYSADKGVVSVNKNFTKDYTAFVNTTPQFLGHGKTPEEAVLDGIKQLDAHILNITTQRFELGY